MSETPEAAAPAQASHESFGRYLAQQRELRGLSLENVADATKLSVGTLKAIEADDYSHLPERVFVIGFVKAYAKCVGLSVEETVLRLEESMGRPPEDVPLLRRKRGKLGWLVGAGVAAVSIGGALWALLHH